jgi:hypothetical protein
MGLNFYDYFDFQKNQGGYKNCETHCKAVGTKIKFSFVGLCLFNLIQPCAY